MRSVLSHCLIYKVHAPPFFPAGFQSTMTVRPSQELFSFLSGLKGLRPRPLRGDSLLNIPPAFSFVNTFFPLFFSFFSPPFYPLNLVPFPSLSYIIYTWIPAGFPLLRTPRRGAPFRRRFPRPARKRLTFPDSMVNSLFVNIFTGFERENNGSGRSPERGAHAESAPFRRRLVRPGAPANHRRHRPLYGSSAV